MNIVLGLTGSVATIVAPKLIAALSELGTVYPVATKCGLRFLDRAPHPIPCQIYKDEDEWDAWDKIGDPVLHIELRNKADVFVIAPLTANTLSKMANGISNNLLTCIFRALKRPANIVVAPAMNTEMWNDQTTHNHLNELDRRYNPVVGPPQFRVVPPVMKTLACGDTGIGAMAEIEDIVKAVKEVVMQWETGVYRHPKVGP
jgi:phosphopantothenoylcysteine decarboxylase